MERIKVDVTGDNKAIMVSRACNNSCLFCHSTKCLSDYPTQDVLNGISENVTGKEKLIQLSGGEPTLRKDLLMLLKRTWEKNQKAKIQIITNARLFSYEKHAKKLSDLNLGIGIATEIHGPNAKIHDRITQTPGSFQQTVQGIRNLLDEDIDVELRVVVHKMNYRHLPDIVRLVEKRFPELEDLFFVNCWPFGHAYENKDLIVCTLKDIAKYLEKAADAAKIKLNFFHFPYCLFRQKYWRYLRQEKFRIGEREGYPSDDCKECIFLNKCPGVWKTYLKIMGNNDFKAIKPSQNFIRRFFSTKSGISLNEIIGVKYDLKQVMVADQLPENWFKRIEDFCIAEGLFAETEHLGDGMIKIYISKSKESLGLAKEYSKDKEDRDSIRNLGRLFGYPECCIDNLVRLKKTRRGDDIIERFIYEENERKKKFNYYLNNFLGSYKLISHFPCSSNCKNSIRIAKRTLEIIKNQHPDKARHITKWLRCPVLFWNENQHIAFDGQVRINEISYRGVIKNEPSIEDLKKKPCDRNLISKFEKGNRVMVDYRTIKIFKNEKMISDIKKKKEIDGFIIDFR